MSVLNLTGFIKDTVGDDFNGAAVDFLKVKLQHWNPVSHTGDF